jgi:hypothetical protein
MHMTYDMSDACRQAATSRYRYRYRSGSVLSAQWRLSGRVDKQQAVPCGLRTPAPPRYAWQ